MHSVGRRARPATGHWRLKHHALPRRAARAGWCGGLRLRVRPLRAVACLRGLQPQPASANAVLPISSRPFAGAFPIGNLFDHDKPIDGDANGYVLTSCSARDAGQVDGHPGYDWRMPEGTPLLAVADAVVLTAGLEAPRYRPSLNRTVQALDVQLSTRRRQAGST